MGLPMAKAKINFEIDEEILANAKAFVAKNGGSLNKLVTALFATLDQDERMRGSAIDPATSVLLDASAGKISILEAASRLKLPDAGYVLQRLTAEKLPLPRLSELELEKLASESFDALSECKIPPAPTAKKRRPMTAAR